MRTTVFFNEDTNKVTLGNQTSNSPIQKQLLINLHNAKLEYKHLGNDIELDLAQFTNIDDFVDQVFKGFNEVPENNPPSVHSNLEFSYPMVVPAMHRKTVEYLKDKMDRYNDGNVGNESLRLQEANHYLQSTKDLMNQYFARHALRM